MISAAFKINISDGINIKLPHTEPNISFVGKISSKAEQIDDDCRFSVELLEYNNFNFGNKEKMIFKLQVVFEAGPDSRFKKLPSRLDTGRLIFITGFLDLDDDEIFVEAKEIDLLDDSFGSINNQLNSKSPFSHTNKFKNNGIKKEKNANTLINVINKDDEISEKVKDNNVNIVEKKRSYNDKKELQVSQKKVKSGDSEDEVEEEYEMNPTNDGNNEIGKKVENIKNTKISTRSQRLKNKLL
jgi:hypothetical protein